MVSMPSFIPFSFFFFFFLLHAPTIEGNSTTIYFSKTTFFNDYQKMLTNLKIFIYPPPPKTNILEESNSSSFSLFHNSLLSSNFITHNPNQATLFFIPFPPLPRRTLARHLEYLRATYPHWSPSLGADHFYFSCLSVGPSFTRDIVELKKNAVRISCFPSPAREFIPHKDITLLPAMFQSRASLENDSTRFLGYWRFAKVRSGLELINGLKDDKEFLIESKPSDEGVYEERLKSSKFCLFVYGDNGDEGVVGLTVALAHGCVPVVITDRPIQDLPLMDVIKWSEIALFVRSNMKSSELKRALKSTRDGSTYERMRRLGVTAAHHFAWNESSPQPYDAFHMVMYQLWLRRHAIKYARWEV